MATFGVGSFFVLLLATAISLFISYLIIKAAVTKATEPLLKELRKLNGEKTENNSIEATKENISYTVKDNKIIYEDGREVKISKSMGKYVTDDDRGVKFHDTFDDAVRYTTER